MIRLFGHQTCYKKIKLSWIEYLGVKNKLMNDVLIKQVQEKAIKCYNLSVFAVLL